MIALKHIYVFARVYGTILGLGLFLQGHAYGVEGKLTIAEAKVHYVFEVAKHIGWPRDEEMDEIIIGVLGSDSELMKAFETRKGETIRGRPFRVERIDELSFPKDRYSLIYLTRKSRHHNKRLFSQVSETLIVADGRISKRDQMVSLITSSREIRIKLNRDNLAKLGFIVSTNMLALAGTKKDLSEQLRDRELHLRDLLMQVKKKEANLAELNGLLDKRSVLLDNAQKTLDTNKQTMAENKKAMEHDKRQLATLSEQIKASQKEVLRNREDVKEQQQLIVDKQEELEDKENAIQLLEANIQQNQAILARQVSSLSEKNTIIETKQKTIVAQRGWITGVAVVAVVFTLMSYWLLRINYLRRKANKELETLNARLYEFATIDGLSQLFNRRHFISCAQKSLVRQIRKDTRAVVLMMDIDYFKRVNDNYGHAMGDEVIKFVADILKKRLREYDLVGRLGGEEFCMMLVDCDENLALCIAQRVCDEVAGREISFEGKTISITLSIGISQLQEDDTEIERVISRADKALYEAKNNGRARVEVFVD